MKESKRESWREEGMRGGGEGERERWKTSKTKKLSRHWGYVIHLQPKPATSHQLTIRGTVLLKF